MSQDLAKQRAQAKALEWLRTFPRAPTFSNFALLRTVARNPDTAPGETADLRAWLATAPAEAAFHGTVLDGVAVTSRAA